MSETLLATMDSANYVATRALGPLEKYYMDDGVEEIVMNRPGEVLIKRPGQDWEPVLDEALDYKYIAKRLCPILAHINGATFSERDVPIVACSLPDQPFRFQAVVGNNVFYNKGDRFGVAIAIRSLRERSDITFANYGLEKGVKKDRLHLTDNFDMSVDDLSKIEQAIDNNQSILVSGPTSSGKTTFTGRVIHLIENDRRVISVEDTKELNLPQPNHVGFIVPRHSGSNHIGYSEIIDSLMRLTPDWVICGELSISNAAGLYTLMGKGHPIITTVHAGNPDEAIKAFATNMMTDGSTADSEMVVEDLHRQVGCIVQLTKARTVSEITFPALESEAKYNKKKSEGLV